MDLTDARVGGTQFSAFMSATDGCESWSAWAGGRIVGPGHHYAAAFLTMCAAFLLSLLLLRSLAKERGRDADTPGRDAG
jgi:hypothetical protein